MKGVCLNYLDIGRRVWSENGLANHGHNRVNVPAKTGGKIIGKSKPYITFDRFLYEVKWDSGQTSIHYENTLHCIGQAVDQEGFEQWILSEAASAEMSIGPNGGDRGSKIILKSGDWINGIQGLQPHLEKMGIPIKIDHIPRMTPSKKIVIPGLTDVWPNEPKTKKIGRPKKNDR